MDNCSIHHVQIGLWNLAIFLPPYSPDYNPCEEMFSYIKYYLKDHDELLNPTSSNPAFRQVLNSVLLSVTESQCKQWISHAGYAGKLEYNNYYKCTVSKCLNVTHDCFVHLLIFSIRNNTIFFQFMPLGQLVNTLCA